MRKGILTMIVVLLLSATPCLAAELEFPQVDELWEQTERYGVEGGTELDEGLSNLFSDALSQGGELLRTSVATGLKLLQWWCCAPQPRDYTAAEAGRACRWWR